MAVQLHADSTADNLPVRQHGEPEKQRQLAPQLVSAPYHDRLRYTAYHVRRQGVDYVSNTAVRHSTLTSVCQDWTRRVSGWGVKRTRFVVSE